MDIPKLSTMAAENGIDLVFVGNKRLYGVDLTKRNYDLENTTPYSLTVPGCVIPETAWGELIRMFVTYYFGLYPGKEAAALAFKCDWSKQYMFSNVKKTNYRQLKENFWVNCNHTALHACWLIQDLLGFFEVDPKDVSLLIHRPSAVEPSFLREEIKKEMIGDFKQYLAMVKDKSESSIEKIVSNIETYLNPLLVGLKRSYDDFFLFQSYNYCYNYGAEVRKVVAAKYGEKNQAILNRYIDYLIDFYKVVF